MLSLQAHPVPAPHSAHSGAPLVQGGVDNGPACAGPSMSVTSCLPASASSLPAHCGPAPPPPSPLACTTVHRSTARPPRLRHHSTSACCLLPPQVRWAGPRPASAGCPGPVCAAHKCGGTQGGRGGGPLPCHAQCGAWYPCPVALPQANPTTWHPASLRCCLVAAANPAAWVRAGSCCCWRRRRWQWRRAPPPRAAPTSRWVPATATSAQTMLPPTVRPRLGGGARRAPRARGCAAPRTGPQV